MYSMLIWSGLIYIPEMPVKVTSGYGIISYEGH